MNIERNIPIPPEGRALLYPWPQMELGDSFCASEKVVGPYGARAFSSWYRWAKRRGITDRRITARRIGRGKVRIWLVATDSLPPTSQPGAGRCASRPTSATVAARSGQSFRSAPSAVVIRETKHCRGASGVGAAARPLS